MPGLELLTDRSAMLTNNDAHEDLPGTGDLLPTRQSLLGRLKDWDDNRSWREFFDTYWRLIFNVALKAGLNRSEAEEVVQETVVSVAKAMKGFQYDPARGSFKGWLLQLTGWRITNQFKKRRGRVPEAETHGGPPADPAGAWQGERAAPPELEQLWESEWEENLLRAAMDRIRRQINPRHFQIFDLCVVQQKPLKEVCAFLDVSAMQVYLARHRVGRLVRQEVARLKKGLI
jgi:RNA polymerase sigma factor (sigma-70 family)